MKKDIYSRYVHEYQQKDGSVRYVVAELVDDEYHVPMTAKERELFGDHPWVARSIDEVARRFGSWKTRRKALRRARYLFGGR